MTVQPDIRLLLADVDGTLVTDDKVLTPAAMEAVADLRAAGIAFAITSSRPPRGMRMLVEPLALETVLAGLNGGVYVDSALAVIRSCPLDLATAKRAVDSLLENGLDVWVYTESELLVRDRDAPHLAREEWILKFDATAVGSFTDAQLARAIKIVGVSDNPAQVAAAENAAEDKCDGRASIACSQSYFLDVTDRRANKGAVVDTLSRLLNIPPARIATIGDGANDVLMFRKSGFSVAMGNASDEVKAQASTVTDSNQSDGFAKAVRSLILQPTAAGERL